MLSIGHLLFGLISVSVMQIRNNKEKIKLYRIIKTFYYRITFSIYQIQLHVAAEMENKSMY